MLRDLAGHDYARYAEVARWPVREAACAFIERMKEQAGRAFRHEQLIWALLAPHAEKKTEAPKLPDLLK